VSENKSAEEQARTSSEIEQSISTDKSSVYYLRRLWYPAEVVEQIKAKNDDYWRHQLKQQTGVIERLNETIEHHAKECDRLEATQKTALSLLNKHKRELLQIERLNDDIGNAAMKKKLHCLLMQIVSDNSELRGLLENKPKLKEIIQL